MAQVPCQNCGFSGERGASGACPRCGHVARPSEEFRVPPLPPPGGPVGSDIEPERQVPPGGYLELDLGLADGARGLDASSPAVPRERRRPAQRTGPAFAAVAPKPVPGSPRSAMPIFIGVGAGCLALILGGVWLSRGAASPSAPATAAAPAPAPATAAPPASPPAPVTQAAEPPPPAEVLAAPATVTHEPEPREARPARNERAGRRAQAAAAPAPVPAPALPPARVRASPSIPTQPTAATSVAATAPTPTAAALPAPPAPVEDAPRYLAEGFRRPQMEEPGCVARSIRAPRDIADRVTDPVTIKFAVGPDGAVSLFQVMGDVPDPRVPDLLEQAVRNCRWKPGADGQGTPIRLWVTMPFRFAK